MYYKIITEKFSNRPKKDWGWNRKTPTLSVGLRICESYPLYRGKTPPHTHTRQKGFLNITFNASDGEIPVLEIWKVWNTLSLSLLLGPIGPGMIVPVTVPYIVQVNLFKIIRIWSECLILYNCKLFVLRIVTWSYNFLLSFIISYLKPYNCCKLMTIGKYSYLRQFNCK